MNNLFSIAHNSLPNELIEVLAEGKNIRIEKITSDGHASAQDFWYDQSEDEWVCILSGDAKILFEDSEIELKKGEHIFIPRHKKHRVKYTSKSCIWLAVFGNF